MPPVQFNCYIDEFGDEGINTGGTRWFILGAIIVPAHLDLQTSTMTHRVKKRFGKPDTWTLHWSDLKQHDRKLFVCEEFLTERWAFACVATDKKSPAVLNARGLRAKFGLYHYSARLLLERLSWYARDHGGGRASLVFEYRSNTSYEAMREYFNLLRAWMPPVQIDWEHIDWKNFQILPKRQNRLLQAADSLVGAVGNALEYSELGFVEPRYVLSLKDRFYRRGSNLLSYGLKFLHADAKELQRLKAEYDWIKNM